MSTTLLRHSRALWPRAFRADRMASSKQQFAKSNTIKSLSFRGSRVLGLWACGLAFGWPQLSLGAAPVSQRPALGEECSSIAPKTDGTSENIQALPFPITLPCAERVGLTGKFGNDQLKNLQHGFDLYSWLTFIALNSPADGTAITQGNAATRTKWEDLRYFRQLSDVMLPGGATPKPWGVRDIPTACTSRFRDGMMVIHLEEEAFNQPFKSGPLIDQNGNYALFDILMNESMHKFIVQNGLNSRKGQTAAMANNRVVKFESGFLPGKNKEGKDDAMSQGDPGALMLKVAWKVLDPIKDNDIKSTFHTVQALIYTPPSNDGKVRATCTGPTMVGLVGFHAVHKTVGRKQWIWTTFEHKDNVPQRRDVDAQIASPRMTILNTRYNFFDPKRLDKPFNRTPLRPWHPRVQPFPDNFRSQITREIAVEPDVEELNREFAQKLKDTVWKNYILVSTQWPSSFACAALDTDQDKIPDPTCAPAPTYLANTTLETFSQGSIPLSSSSCMACHGNATTRQNPAMQSDFTFMLEKAQ